MNREAIIKTILRFYPHTEAIYLFGSSVTNNLRPESDVDIGVLFSPDLAKQIKTRDLGECREDLERALQRTVDLINVRTANTVFQNEIIEEGEVIYKQSEFAVDQFEMQVLSSYQKLNEERSGILEEILASGRILK